MTPKVNPVTLTLYSSPPKGETTHYILCVASALLQNVFAVHRKGDTTTLGPKGRQTYEPSGQGPVNLKNPHTAGVSSEPGPQSGPLLPLIPHCKKSQYIIN